jgi:hypothetical protein
MKNSNDIMNRSRNPPVCSAVPHSLRHRVPLCCLYLRDLNDKPTGIFYSRKLKICNCDVESSVITYPRRLIQIRPLLEDVQQWN